MTTRRALFRGCTLAAFTQGDLEAIAPPLPPDVPEIPRCQHTSVRAGLSPDHAELIVSCDDCGVTLKRAAAAPAEPTS